MDVKGVLRGLTGVLMMATMATAAMASLQSAAPADEVSAGIASCLSATAGGGTQAAMNRCAQQEYERQDKRLNEVYQTYRGQLNKEQQALLKKAQQAWLQYRDADCAFESAGAGGGSAGPMVSAQCLAQKTAERVKALQRLGLCEEGDISCPQR